jgi:hypothetical protein
MLDPQIKSAIAIEARWSMRNPAKLTVQTMLVVALAVLSVDTSTAHHSGAQYDRTVVVEKEATVVRFDFRNPHAYLIVTDTDGVEWMVEMISAVRLRREGWNAESFGRGDQVTFRAIANRDPQKNRIRLRSLTAANGLEFDLSQQDDDSAELKSFTAVTSLEGVWVTDPDTFDEISDSITNYPLTSKGQEAKESFDDTLDPVANCTSWPIPQLAIVSGLYPMNFELSDDKVVIRYEFFNTRRTVFMDGRDHPTDAPRTIQGHSIGHWEDEALVIDSRLFADHRSPFMFDGVPSGAGKHVIERYRLSEDGTYTTASYFVEDPEFLAEPLEFDLKLRYKPNFELQDNACDPEIARRFLQ